MHQAVRPQLPADVRQAGDVGADLRRGEDEQGLLHRHEEEALLHRAGQVRQPDPAGRPQLPPSVHRRPARHRLQSCQEAQDTHDVLVSKNTIACTYTCQICKREQK